MSKKRQGKKPEKIKEKPVMDLVKSILPRRNLSLNYINEVKQNYVEFVYRYKGRNFNTVLKHLLNNQYFREISPTFHFDFEQKPRELVFEGIPFDNLLDILLVPLSLYSDKIKSFNVLREKFENLFIYGNKTEISLILDEIKRDYGDTLWLVKANLMYLEHYDEHTELKEYIKHLLNKEQEYNINKNIASLSTIYETADPKLIIENTLVRDINEFIDGEALDFASITLLMFIPFPDNLQLHPYYSFQWLQDYNYLDLYVLIKEISIQADIYHRSSIEVEEESSITKRILSTIEVIEPDWNKKHPPKNKHYELYKKGYYKELVDDLELLGGGGDIFASNLNVYAKSYIYLHREPSGYLPSFLRTCILNLINIYNLKDIQQSITNLETIIYNTNHFDISKHITVALFKALPYGFRSLHRLQVSFFKNYMCCGGTDSSRLIPFSPYQVIKDELLDNTDKQIAKRLYLENPTKNNLENYKELKPIYKDVLELVAAKMIESKQLEELLIFSVNELLKNDASYICFPMQLISEYVELNQIETEDAVIFNYFYSLLIDKDRVDSLNQVFEEFILDMGIERPSEIFEIKDSLSDKEIFIMREVSKVSVMDYMGCFIGTTDIKYERINILNSLKNLGLPEYEQLENEYQDILKEILLDDATATLNTAKVQVDRQSIFKVNSSKIKSLGRHFFIALDLYNKNKDEQEENEDYYVSVNNLLVDIYQFLMSEYLHNLEYGLDNNLSGEIRHTYFSNLMSSKLETNNLITELKGDNYKSNEHWLDYYQIVHPKILGEMDKRLMKFSKDFNELLDIAESWMKVSIDNAKPERVFVFDNAGDCFANDIDRFLQADSLDELVTLIFDSLNKQLDNCLNVMRSKIDHDFSISLDDLFEELILDLNRIKQGSSLTELIRVLEKVRNDIKEDVKTLSDWFNLRSPKIFSSYLLTEVLRICERCLGVEVDITESGNRERSPVTEVSGDYVPSLVMALNNCILNAKKHLSNNEVIKAKIFGKKDGSYRIQILNSISKEHESCMLAGELSRARNKLENMNSNSLLVKEGGTGLYKSKFKLQSLSNNFDLKIDVIDKNFITEVSYNV